jgi:hypothetical protein
MLATKRLYYDAIGDPAPLADLAAALDQLPHRTRRAIELRAGGAAWRHIGQKMHLTTGGAAALVRRAFNRANKQMLNLPRYHQIGHPPPMKKTKPHDPHAAVAAAQVPKVTQSLSHTLHPPPRDAKGRILKRQPAGDLHTTPADIKPPHPLPY